MFKIFPIQQRRQGEYCNYKLLANSVLQCDFNGETQDLDFSGEWSSIEPDENGMIDSLGLVRKAYKKNGVIHIHLLAPFINSEDYIPSENREYVDLVEGQTLEFNGGD